MAWDLRGKDEAAWQSSEGKQRICSAVQMGRGQRRPGLRVEELWRPACPHPGRPAQEHSVSSVTGRGRHCTARMMSDTCLNGHPACHTERDLRSKEGSIDRKITLIA